MSNFVRNNNNDQDLSFDDEDDINIENSGSPEVSLVYFLFLRTDIFLLFYI
jgi:hypothetical protein